MASSWLPEVRVDWDKLRSYAEPAREFLADISPGYGDYRALDRAGGNYKQMINALREGQLGQAAGQGATGLAESISAIPGLGEIAAGSKMLAGALGPIIYHGTHAKWSPKDDAPFGQFDLDRMGTGEGAQYKGWGAYGAERRGIAEGYREALSAGNREPTFKLAGENLNDKFKGYRERMKSVRGGGKEAYDAERALIQAEPNYDYDAAAYDFMTRIATGDNPAQWNDPKLQQQVFDLWARPNLSPEMAGRIEEGIKRGDFIVEQPSKGHLYEWDIPDEIYDTKFLDLDADLVDQPRDVAELLARQGKVEPRPLPGGFTVRELPPIKTNELGDVLRDRMDWGDAYDAPQYEILDSLGRRVENVTPKWQNADEFADEYFAGMQRAGIDDVMDRDFIKGKYKPLHEERVAQWNLKTGDELDKQARQAEGSGWDWYLDLVNGLRGGPELRNIPPNDPHARIVSEEILGGEGIPGLKFLDNPSRPRSSKTPERQTRNVVVWDDSLLKALRRHDY